MCLPDPCGLRKTLVFVSFLAQCAVFTVPEILHLAGKFPGEYVHCQLITPRLVLTGNLVRQVQPLLKEIISQIN